MKNNNLKIRMTNPCSEKFENFTSTEKGGFCQSCQTEVIDFTNMSKEEIQDYFKDKLNQRICGRFKKEDLDYPVSQIKKMESKKYKFLGAASVIGFSLLSFLNPNSIYAQKNTNKTHQVETDKKHENTNQIKEYTVKGNVSDEDGSLPSASIVLKYSQIGTETDFDGNFEFPEKLKAGDVLVFSYVGFRDKEYTITGKESGEVISLEIILDSGNAFICGIELGGAIAESEIYESKPTFFQRIKNIFKKKEN
ncbi:carboxypeptidase-like regulatory domain-containing protein [Aureivirga sp. CE67]|uniref:carboxypeptidase-like regulatory domain-containing protein n=1 Tax=Aureivirga sp. CE67 TaxID=1788983 RepID=UPI0018C9D598|nr:carboxypeptidase-like regulatory domain-containing protein [Aureivirga sp. CE67]